MKIDASARALLLISLAIALFCPRLHADGGVFKSADTSMFFPASENEQVAFIACADGRELLVLAVNFEVEANESAVWILPVPAPPDRVKAHLVDRFPTLRGFDPARRLKARASELFSLLFSASCLFLARFSG